MQPIMGHALVLFVSLFAGASAVLAAELRVISNPGMKDAFEVLGPQFRTDSGHGIAVTYGLFKQLQAPIDAGAFDVAISTGAVTDYLAQTKRIAAGSSVRIARVGIGVAIRRGAARPDIGTVEAFKRTLLGAKSISYTAGSAAGTHIAGVIERLGIAEQVKAKTTLMSGGGQNPKAVAAGEIELGLSIVSDIVVVPGAEVLGLLPAELQSYVIEIAGVGTTAKDMDAARQFVGFLASPQAMQVLIANGFERVDP